MITVNTTVGTEVEGIQIDDELEQKVMASLTQYQKARTINDRVEIHLALAVAIVDRIPIEQAIVYVKGHTTRIS